MPDSPSPDASAPALFTPADGVRRQRIGRRHQWVTRLQQAATQPQPSELSPSPPPPARAPASPSNLGSPEETTHLLGNFEDPSKLRSPEVTTPPRAKSPRTLTARQVVATALKFAGAKEAFVLSSSLPPLPENRFEAMEFAHAREEAMQEGREETGQTATSPVHMPGLNAGSVTSTTSQELSTTTGSGEGLTIDEATLKMASQFRMLHDMATGHGAKSYERKHYVFAAAVALQKWLELQGKPSQIIKIVEGEDDRQAMLDLAKKLAALREAKAS